MAPISIFESLAEALQRRMPGSNVSPKAHLLFSRSTSSSSTSTLIGAILGSILGALVLITLFYKCCIDNRSAAWIPPSSSYDDAESRPGISGHRGGWGSEVKRPERARTREGRGYRREVRVGEDGGMLGWWLVPVDRREGRRMRLEEMSSVDD